MNTELLQELYKKYDKKELEKWNKRFTDDKVKSLSCFCRYEDVGVLYHCNTVAELEELYKFIHYGVGVEFAQSVYELIDDEEADGDTETADMLELFNKAMGRNIL